MTRAFNVSGPCRADIHYMLPAVARLPNVTRLIDQQNYFVLHAPRQTGKTTAMLALAAELTAAGQVAAVLISAEVGAPYPDDPEAAERAMLDSWRDDAEHQLPLSCQPPSWPEAAPGRQIGAALRAWTQAIDRPLVIFLDEIDALRDTTLIAVLRQLRDGFRRRPTGFPAALALIGLRDVRDYKVAAGGSDRLNTASPFNIKARSLTLGNFSRREIAALYQQHTDATGQRFAPAAVTQAFAATQGQPWLVNALAKMAVEELQPDGAEPITAGVIDAAQAQLIARQDTHLDSLVERLREQRVRAIIEPMVSGAPLGSVPPDDIQFVIDLGLCRLEPNGGLVIANPIYREVLLRVLATATRASLPTIAPTWLAADGQLDPARLLDAFVAFWRRHGEPLLGTTDYHEVAPHIVLMAFLDRVANGGGTIEREYAVGRGRMDICLRYGAVTVAIEVKVWRAGEADPQREGLEQLDAYLAGLNLSTGWLIIFDQRGTRRGRVDPVAVTTAATPSQRQVTVIRA